MLLLLHGGTESGGALTTALMISFDLVILTGLFGILIYFCAHADAHRGRPAAVDQRTNARREELSAELGATIAAAESGTRQLVEQRVLPRTMALGLLRQFFKRETLDDMLTAYSSANLTRSWRG
ncbi:MAG: hypothetical protein U0X75_18120 [Acidobacteriota bacterium]